MTDSQVRAAHIARLLQGRIPFRNMIFRLGNGGGRFVELGGLRRRRRLTTQNGDVDPVPSPAGQELMRSGDFGAVGTPGVGYLK